MTLAAARLGPPTRRWAAPASAAAAAAAGTAAFALHNPFHPGAWPTCPFHAATGLWCPLCGGTRAFYAAAHGHLELMAANNPLLPLWAAMAVWGWLWWLSKLELLPVRIPSPLSAPWLRVGIPFVLGLFWVARNLPGLAVLAPHGHL